MDYQKTTSTNVVFSNRKVIISFLRKIKLQVIRTELQDVSRTKVGKKEEDDENGIC